MVPAATAALAAAAAAEMVPRRYSTLYIHVIYACVWGESLKETRFFFLHTTKLCFVIRID